MSLCCVSSANLFCESVFQVCDVDSMDEMSGNRTGCVSSSLSLESVYNALYNVNNRTPVSHISYV